MKIYLGADHRGYELKEKISRWLFAWGYKFEDFGAESLNPGDDYTVYAEKVASVVGKEEGSRGILLCGSGVGVDVVANKLDGVSASVGKSPEQVKAGRNDDDMNILVIAADYTKESEAKEMIRTFLQTKFSGKERFVRRLEDIKKIEANN
ncbi:MAG: RpiB/LacA/LacB family sugar-phosphate isomerase [Patescibacteria group bacterium]